MITARSLAFIAAATLPLVFAWPAASDTAPPAPQASPAPSPSEVPAELPEQVPEAQPTVTLPFEIPADAQVDVVGVYEGVYPSGVRHSHNNHPFGSATVTVKSSDRPRIVVLCAYEPVKWDVRLEPGARVVGLILSGYYEQQVTVAEMTPGQEVAVAKNVPAHKLSYEGGRQVDYFYCYSLSAAPESGERESKADRTRRRIREMTGREISSFSGAYAGGRFTVQ